jgi:hypothetical protein
VSKLARTSFSRDARDYRRKHGLALLVVRMVWQDGTDQTIQLLTDDHQLRQVLAALEEPDEVVP